MTVSQVNKLEHFFVVNMYDRCVTESSVEDRVMHKMPGTINQIQNKV